MAEIFLKSFDNGGRVGMQLAELLKTFDCLRDDLLITKLEACT